MLKIVPLHHSRVAPVLPADIPSSQKSQYSCVAARFGKSRNHMLFTIIFASLGEIAKPITTRACATLKFNGND